jgi:hypothetical protein
MRSPVLATPPVVSTKAPVAWATIAMLAAAILALYVLRFAGSAVPPEILDGLTSPPQFDVWTT